MARVLQPPSRSCATSSQRILRQFSKPWSAQHLVSSVRLDAKDEHVKNDGALTARTIERIAGESAGVTTEPAVVTGARRAIGLEQTI